MSAPRTKEELAAEIRQIEYKIGLSEVDLDSAREPLAALYREKHRIEGEIAQHATYKKQIETQLSVYGRQKAAAQVELRQLLEAEIEAQFQALLQKS